MNRRQFFIVLAALAVLAALGAAVVLSERSAWTSADSRAGQKAIAGMRLSEVAEIAIRDSAGELHRMSFASRKNDRCGKQAQPAARQPERRRFERE